MTQTLIEQRTAAGNAYLTLARVGGTLLAFTHGWRDSPEAWRWVIDSLQDRETNHPLEVIAVRRQAGHLRDLASAALLETYATQVVDAVNTAAPDVERVVLAGHSMGGAVTELAAAKLAGRVAGLVLVNPSPLAGCPLPPDVIETFESLSALSSADAADARTGFSFHATEELRARYRIATPEESIRSCLESFRAWHGGHPVGLAHSNITAPTLLVTSDDTFFSDAMLRAEVAPRFPSIEVTKIAGAGHDPHIETPDQLADTIAAFIGRL